METNSPKSPPICSKLSSSMQTGKETLIKSLKNLYIYHQIPLPLYPKTQQQWQIGSSSLCWSPWSSVLPSLIHRPPDLQWSLLLLLRPLRWFHLQHRHQRSHHQSLRWFHRRLLQCPRLRQVRRRRTRLRRAALKPWSPVRWSPQ